LPLHLVLDLANPARVRFALVHAPAVLEAAVERMAPSGLQLTEGGSRELRELRAEGATPWIDKFRGKDLDGLG